MLPRYIRWRMERALAPLLLLDHEPEAAVARRTSIVAPAKRSETAERKVRARRTDEGDPARSFDTLLADLRTLTKNDTRIASEVTPA